MYKYKHVIHKTDVKVLNEHINDFEIAILNQDSEFCFKSAYMFDELGIKVEFSYNPYICDDTRIVIVSSPEELPEFDQTIFLGAWDEKAFGDIKVDENRLKAINGYLIIHFENAIEFLKGEWLNV